MAKHILSATLAQISDFFDLCLHWVFVVCGTSTWDQNVWNRWIWLDTTCLIIHAICNGNKQYVLSPNCAINLNTDRRSQEFCGCNHSFFTSLTMPSLKLQDVSLQIMAMAIVLEPGRSYERPTYSQVSIKQAARLTTYVSS